LKKKFVIIVIGIILLSSYIPIIDGDNNDFIKSDYEENSFLSDIELKERNKIKTNTTLNLKKLNNITFFDFLDDVFLLPFVGELYRYWEDVPNINIVSGGVNKQNNNITLFVEVDGIIENSGSLDEPLSGDLVIYSFFLETSVRSYQIEYINKSCNLFTSNYTSMCNYSVDNSKLFIYYNFLDKTEEIVLIEVAALYVDIDNIAYPYLLDLGTSRDIYVNINVSKPDDYLYIFNKQVVPFNIPLIIGNIDFEIIDINSTDIIVLLELYIDDIFLKSKDYNIDNPLSWNKFSFGKHKVKILAFDLYGNRDYVELDVWKFF